MTEPAATKELRLALVLYGGVSLAIYMHGITKELHKLVIASAALDANDAANPFPAATTEHVYWEALKHLAEENDVRTRVVIDVIAGTSAGGINGIYLAKALAQNVNQDELSKLWIEKGDIAKLLRGPAVGRGKLRLVLPFLGALLRQGKNAPILRGDVMSGWYVEALKNMDETRPKPDEGLQSLMPDDHDLELFVPATDFHGYVRQIPIEDPRAVTDLRHRHVFEFCRPGAGANDPDDPNQFEPEYNYALAFAARSTSSFPAAFPAINFADFEASFHPPIKLGSFAHDFCRVYELSDAKAEDTYFIDGGILDNYPFDHAIRAMRRRSASGQVERRLLYVQPDPRGKAVKKGAPGWVATALGGFATIPSQQPILDQLLDVLELNERVATIRQIIESSFGRIQGKVEKLPGSQRLDALLDAADAAALQAVRDAATAEANREIGPGYTTYVRTKIRAVVDDFAALVNHLCDYPDESNHAFFVRAVVNAWADDGKLFERQPTATAAQIEFLRQFDLDYTRRLLRFLIAAVSWWYEDDVDHDADPPSRSQLDQAKALLYRRLDKIEQLMSGDAFEESMKARLREVFGEDAIKDALGDAGLDPEPFLTDDRKGKLRAIRDDIAAFLSQEQQLGTFSPDLTLALCKLTSTWDEKARAAFFVRYLGFAFWDVLLFPVQFLAEAGERDAVEVLRVSPLDSRLLHPPGPADTQKLKGLGLYHFAAFLERDYRENDYLWGRLDGAERLLVLLLGHSDLECASRCVDAFAAILAEEAGPLGTTKELVASLRPQLDAIRALAQTADEALRGQAPDLRPREDFAPELNGVVGEAVARIVSGGETQAEAERRLGELLARILADTKEESPRRRFANAGVPRPIT
jgi:patatin-related protein